MAEKPFLTYDLMDANKAPVSLKYWVSEPSVAATYRADLAASAASLLTAVDAVTQSQIINVWYHLPLAVGGKAGPVTGTNNQDGSLIKFPSPALPDTFSYWTPNFIPAGFESTHENVVDFTNVAVIAYIAALTTALTHMQVTDEDGDLLTSPAVKGIKSARKQRRALGRAR